MFQTELSLEQQVARNRGDYDWEEILDVGLAPGCTRKATYERERADRYEPEPTRRAVKPKH